MIFHINFGSLFDLFLLDSVPDLPDDDDLDHIPLEPENPFDLDKIPLPPLPKDSMSPHAGKFSRNCFT